MHASDRKIYAVCAVSKRTIHGANPFFCIADANVGKSAEFSAFPAPNSSSSFARINLFGPRRKFEKAVDALSSEELAKLAAYIARHDKLAWDEQLERDFSPGGKHAGVIDKVDAEIDAGNFTPQP